MIVDYKLARLEPPFRYSCCHLYDVHQLFSINSHSKKSFMYEIRIHEIESTSIERKEDRMILMFTNKQVNEVPFTNLIAKRNNVFSPAINLLQWQHQALPPFISHEEIMQPMHEESRKWSCEGNHIKR